LRSAFFLFEKAYTNTAQSLPVEMEPSVSMIDDKERVRVLLLVPHPH
jgi:hypothetical protein